MFFRRKKKTTPDPFSGAASGEGLRDPLADGPEGKVAATPSTQFLTGEASTDRRTVQVLLEAIAQVSESRDLESLLIDIVDRSVELTGAERGLLVMRGPADGTSLEVRVARRRGKKPVVGDVRFSTSIAGKVLKEVQGIRATVHSESEALELGRSVYDLKLRAVMCVPLAPEGMDGQASSPPSGVLYVDSRAATRQFDQRDLSLFAALAQHISIAMENARLHLDSLEKVRLEQSLELAGAIQRDLMPQVPANLEGWDLHGWYGPAEGTAGDFYDFIKMKDESLSIVVGDVTGHGIGPALITSAAQSSLRAYTRMISDPGEIITMLNQDICERVEDGRFLTLFLAQIDAQGDMRGINAGHALPLLFRRATGEIEVIGRGGPALGMIPDETYTAHAPVHLEPGDVLVVYTDGLTEARPPGEPENFLGEQGLKRALVEAASAGLDAKAICLKLVESAMAFSKGVREDDITVVVARRREDAGKGS